MTPPRVRNELADVLRARRHHFQSQNLVKLFSSVDQKRVEQIAEALAAYISVNLPRAIDRRENLADYRTNPYVLLTTASVMKLSNPRRFADFLFNNKLYMGLETSFGKSIEAALMGQYPMDLKAGGPWEEPPEKRKEFELLNGLTRQERALARNDSVWREIDKSCVRGKTRYLLTIKSGPACINDTQVEGMKNAIEKHHQVWFKQSQKTFPDVDNLSIVVGITYGTDSTTNNKENQILVKLLGKGFEEESRTSSPGVLIDSASKSIRVYRVIGQEFWAFVGNPEKPNLASSVFLEILLALSKALSKGMEAADLETKLNHKILGLAEALKNMTVADASLPTWVRGKFSEDELFWLATALTAFFDEGV